MRTGKRKSPTGVLVNIIPTEMANVSRLKVLSMFKKLHRTSQKVFNEDLEAIGVVREKINQEFRDNAHHTDPDKINELLKVADEAEMTLRETVIQAEYVPDKQVFEVKVREDTKLLDNMPFDPTKSPDRSKRGKKCS